MAYSEQTLGQLSVACSHASNILMVEVPDIFRSPIDIRDGLIMQAVSHVLLHATTFSESPILQLTGLRHSSVSGRFKRYSEADMMHEIKRVSGAGRRGNPHRIFETTEFGNRILGFFQAHS